MSPNRSRFRIFLPTVVVLCLGVQSRAAAREDIEPVYGVESTITNPALSALCDDRSVRTFKRLMKLAPKAHGAGLMRRCARSFPDQVAVFEKFASAFFVGSSVPPVLIHRDMPAYVRKFGDASWLRIQFEAQAIELQATPGTISFFLKEMAAEIDARFFATGRRLRLRPHREWGMGHLHEEQAPAGQVPNARALRNRVVGEFSDEYFWDLVGPNIEADIHWETHAEKMELFKRWLPRFDRWLNAPVGTIEDRERICSEMIDDLLLHPLFKSLPPRLRNDLGGGLLTYQNGFAAIGELARLAEDHLREVILGRMFKYAVMGITKGRARAAFQLRNPESTDALTLEFRRVPAHRDADEAARWMNLLRGRRRRADAAELIPLVTPAPPRTDRDRLETFARYCASANVHPRDYARFLPSHLAWRARLISSNAPRWVQVRRRLLCEDVIRH